MKIRDLVPWSHEETQHPVRRAGDPMLDITQRMNSLFDEFFGDFGHWPWLPRTSHSLPLQPRMDVSETKDTFRVEVELPGVDEKDVELTLSDGVLTLRGEKREENREELDGWHSFERSFGSFQRSLSLPPGIDSDKAQASFQKGVLRVEIPKTAEAREKTRRIKIRSDE